MKNELIKMLNDKNDDFDRCEANIKEVNNIIKEIGYTKTLVDMLVDFNVIMTKLQHQIKQIQEDLEIIQKSIDYDRSNRN